MGHVKFHAIRLEMVLVLVQDSCTVCAKRTIGSGIVLDTLDGTPRSCGISFGPFERLLALVQDRCTVCAKRTIDLDIV